MARTKNRGEINALSPFYTQAPVWRLGKYLRLSKDDFKRGTLKDRDKAKTISDSIENQRKILNDQAGMFAIFAALTKCRVQDAPCTQSRITG